MMILALCLLVFFYTLGQLAIKESRKDLGVNYLLCISPLPGDLVRIFAGEFKGLVADYLLLELGSFMGSDQEISSKDWTRVALAFEQALQLDPYFQQTYIYVQGCLPWGANMPRKAISLLDISKKHRPWDWRPGYYMGFDYYYFLKDYSKASEIFLDTAKIEGAPVLLAVLGARFALKSGRTETAIILLKAMLEELDSEAELEPGEEAKKKEIQDRLSALYGVSYLEKAITRFKNNYNVYPESLEVLLKAGFISEIPLNPYGTSYYYDPTTGTVNFDKIH